MSDHANLAAALVAAASHLTIVDKGRTAKIPTKDGKSYEYEYADLGDVIKLTRPVLAEHGLVVLTPVEEHGNGLKCTVVLLHSSGERLDFGPFPFPHGQTAQATGSMVTYYRRYALVAALGMAAGDDDDGAQAQPRQEPAKRTEPNPKAEPLIDRLAVLPEDVQNTLLQWFKVSPAEWSTLDDGPLDKLAEQISKAEKIATPASGDAGTQEEPRVPGPAAPPAPAVPLSAAERAAARGTKDKPALGAVKDGEPRGVEGFTEAFPGSEVGVS